MKKTYIIVILVGVFLAIAASVFVVFVYPAMIKPVAYYNDAVTLYNSGNYVAAALRFEALGGYDEQARLSWMKAADASFAAGDLAQARTYYQKASAGSAVFDSIDAAYYENGVSAYAEDKRIEAENCFSCITHGSPYLSNVDSVRLSAAERFLSYGDFDSAEKIFRLCDSANNARISELWIEHGVEALDEKNIGSAAICFTRALIYSTDKDGTTVEIDSYWSAAGDKASQQGDYDFADSCFGHMSGGSEEIVAMRSAYEDAVAALAEGRYLAALNGFISASGFRDADERADELKRRYENFYAANGAGFYATLSLDGKVSFFGSWGSIPEPLWSDVDSIAVGSERFLVGVKQDGTVRFTGNGSYGNSEVDDWTNIVSVACGSTHTVGLRSDGTVVACGDDSKGQVSGVKEWTNIASISACGNTTVGLKTDGTVVVCGSIDAASLSDVTGIIAVSCGNSHIVCLRFDGTVVSCGSNEAGQRKVSEWTDIVAVRAGANHTVGLKADGTLVACGSNNKGECNVEGVENVLTFACGNGFTLVLLRDGTQVKLGKFE